jgi:hypothetical protein
MLGGRSVCAETPVRPVSKMAQTRTEWIRRGGLVREDKTFMEMNLRAARVKYLSNQKKAMLVCDWQWRRLARFFYQVTVSNGRQAKSSSAASSQVANKPMVLLRLAGDTTIAALNPLFLRAAAPCRSYN